MSLSLVARCDTAGAMVQSGQPAGSEEDRCVE
jgi:hypothetical protein